MDGNHKECLAFIAIGWLAAMFMAAPAGYQALVTLGILPIVP